MCEEARRQVLLLPGDLATEHGCKAAVQGAVDKFGRIDILVRRANDEDTSLQVRNASESPQCAAMQGPIDKAGRIDILGGARCCTWVTHFVCSRITSASIADCAELPMRRAASTL